MRIRHIFLDDGGVLNDNVVRAAEWRRLVGEFLAPQLGGAPSAWGEANHALFSDQWQRFETWLRTRAPEDTCDFFGQAVERERWLRGMCEHVGIAAPAHDHCVALAIETEAYVLPRVRAAYDGAVDTVRWLAERYQLSMASGGTSRELDGYLRGMGLRALFGEKLYGPDLIGAMKGDPAYYPRIFADTGVNPSEALVVEDQQYAVTRAREAGATAVVVSAAVQDAGPPTITSLAALPALLESLS